MRADTRPGLMEVFLAEYGLSTEEGVALMCLAEALLRVPDAETVDALIEDKIAPSEWGAHLGHSSSPLVNASTWALMLTGRVLRRRSRAGRRRTLRGAVKRLGEPVIRTAVRRAMREMGNQFVLGEDIDAAMARGAAHGGEGLHLFLRHAGRGGADGGRRAGYLRRLSLAPSPGSRAPRRRGRHRAVTPASRSSSRRCIPLRGIPA
jgi:RHH-type proline utilization regulon transcriptional repressor/proline dehydrogenase/delta 1-pyrroline-5-carboxylate dehydrogenase